MDKNGVLENFLFLVAEVKNQVRTTLKLINDLDLDLLDRIDSKDDYIDNLKSFLEDRCFSYIYSTGKSDPEGVIKYQSIYFTTVNLERIADFCVNVARQTQYLTDIYFMHQYDYISMFNKINECLDMIPGLLNSTDLADALYICRAEEQLDNLYKANFDRIMIDIQESSSRIVSSAVEHGLSHLLDQLKGNPETLFDQSTSGNTMEKICQDITSDITPVLIKRHMFNDHITAIFIFRYLERIGDSLLNIGEALIFGIIGERIKIRQLRALEETLSESGFEGSLGDIDFRPIMGSRSGCRIGKVEQRKGSGSRAQGIFKEGSIDKITREKDNIDKWNSCVPGIAPKVYGYTSKHKTASLLVEFFPGCTLDEVILNADSEIFDNAVFILESIILDIWEKTRQDQPSKTGALRQLKDRLPVIEGIHSHLFNGKKVIQGQSISSSLELIQKCADIEDQLNCPFSMLLHGDFNTNNIIYNHDEQKINFMDLNRSKMGDYVQDASVFIVSNFRSPVFDQKGRNRLNRVIRHFYNLFIEFAERNNDALFEMRMAAALARSFFTSTRFELNKTFASDMFMRGTYLMGKICEFEDQPFETFRLPDGVLYYN
ncbi:MAG: PhoU domain-containing protein [Desulfobacteraceae bacterium]|jgi:phosphate uptake regulator